MFSMRWSHVLLIFRREVRDQLRDRRTLFMIFVLPILLYPMLGIGVAQLSIAFERKPRTVLVVGPENLPESPPLLNEQGDGFAPSLFDVPNEARLYTVKRIPADSPEAQAPALRNRLRRGDADAILPIPADIQEQITRDFQTVEIPITFFSADEKSLDTYRAVDSVLKNWKDQITKRRLERDQKPESYLQPVRIVAQDVASRVEAGGSLWGRIFPFLLVMMSLTGAFYPAVDLCAGKKNAGPWRRF